MPTIIAYKAQWERVERIVKGSLAPAEEDIEDIPVNLSPFFSHGRPLNGSYDDYWNSFAPGRFPEIDDNGWATLSFRNASTTSVMFANFFVNADESLVPGESYTLLVEWKESTFSDGDVKVIPSNYASAQLVASGESVNGESGEARFVMTARDGERTLLVRTYFEMAKAIDSETPREGTARVRASLYEGEYEGAYVPYLESRIEEVDEGGQDG